MNNTVKYTGVFFLSQDERLLIVLNNCRYVRNNVLPKLVDSFRNNDYPISDKLKKVRSPGDRTILMCRGLCLRTVS